MKILLKALAALIAVSLLASCAQTVPSESSSGSGVSSETASYPTEPIKRENKGEMKEIALKVYDDLLKNFWDEEKNCFFRDSQGFVNKLLVKSKAVWSNGMIILGMDLLYDLTKDQSISDKITAQWEANKTYFTDEAFVTPIMNPNPASDDCGWNAMMYMVFYKHSKDQYALDVVKRLVMNSFEHYKIDGDLKNGMWYTTHPDQGDPYKYSSMSSAGLINAALDYYDITKDQVYYDMAKVSYEYLERVHLRKGVQEYDGFTVDCDDLLYFCDFNYNRESRSEPNGPDGGKRPNDIKEAGSVSYLAGNIAMAALHARFYKYTGEEHYKTRALETVRALNNSPYYVTKDDVWVNDRDAWADCTFNQYFIRDAMTLPGITERDFDIFFNTARSIYENARTDDGYYGGSWSGAATGPKSKWWVVGSKPEQFMTSGNSALMVMSAARLEQIIAK